MIENRRQSAKYLVDKDFLDSLVKERDSILTTLEILADGSLTERGRKEGCVVATLDADFHALLALSGATLPSVIRVRIEGLRAEPLAKLLARALEMCEQDLNAGSMVSVTETSVRIKHLPLFR